MDRRWLPLFHLRMAVPGTVEGEGEEAFGAPSAPVASGTVLKVATRPAVVGPIWFDLFHPGTPPSPSPRARLRVVADVVGALTHIHGNSGLPREHRRHGRLTPRHVLVGVDGTASLFETKQPFSKLLPGQPDLGYLAPELLTQSAPPDQRSDVFSIGVMLWEALDNGRLFPHHRAAAISRLIARKALPAPRVIEEWALPFVDVAQKALAPEPQDRYQCANELWLALREHLPSPDDAREELAQLAQGVLKLSLTSDIRSEPPFLSGGAPLLTHDSFDAAMASHGPQLLESESRYSMPVDHGSLAPRSRRAPVISQAAPRQPSLPPLDWTSLMPAPSSRPLSFDYGRESLQPTNRGAHSPASARHSLPPSSQRQSHAPRVSQRPHEPDYRERESASPRLSGYPHGESYRSVDPHYAAPEPHYASPEPELHAPEPMRHSWAPPESEPGAQRSSPWLAITLVVVAFGGVGLGALVFGAGSMMAPKVGAEFHPPPVVAPVQSPAESAAAHSLDGRGVSESETAPAPNAVVPAPSEAPAPAAAPLSRTTTSAARAKETRRAAPKRPKAAPAASAEAKPEPESKPEAAPPEAPSGVPESLPFVNEPWSK
ncbi:MAG: hypothetical protein ABW217_14385 [Polyangiaceae bacterium]